MASITVLQELKMVRHFKTESKIFLKNFLSINLIRPTNVTNFQVNTVNLSSKKNSCIKISPKRQENRGRQKHAFHELYSLFLLTSHVLKFYLVVSEHPVQNNCCLVPPRLSSFKQTMFALQYFVETTITTPPFVFVLTIKIKP